MATSTPEGPVGGLWARFRRKAEEVAATVLAAPDPDAAPLLLLRAGALPLATLALARRYPGLAGRWPRVGSPSAAPADVITAAAFAVAETGSLAIVEGSAGDRAACLLAERLWVLVPASAIEPTLDQALERIGRLVAAGARYATLMTGPSRTADIERVLTTGVHGPREVRVIVVGAAEREAASRA